jgi:hypothetical protein
MTENGWGFSANSDGRRGFQRTLVTGDRFLLTPIASSGFWETLAATNNELQKKMRARKRSLNSENNLWFFFLKKKNSFYEN